MLRCPKCKKDCVIAIQSVEDNYLAVRRCLACGCAFTPVRIPQEDFLTAEMKLRQAKANQDASAQACLDEYLEKKERARKGLN